MIHITAAPTAHSRQAIASPPAVESAPAAAQFAWLSQPLSVKAVRRRITPHVARNINAHRGSNIDARTTRHAGYPVSQVIRKRIEEANGWIKCVVGMEQTKHRGLARVGWMFQLKAAAYNLVRLPKLIPTG